MTNLAQKVVVITGGARGIGREVALACARSQAQVVICSRTAADLKLTQELILAQTGLVCDCYTVDVADDRQLEQMAGSVKDRYGRIYGLICAAGIYGDIGPFLDSNFNDWIKALDINLTATAKTVHCFGRLMRDNGGRIILFSGGGQGPMPFFSGYVTSKGGIWRLTETLGHELKDQGIFVNAIAPGAINTKFLDAVLAAGPERVGKGFYEKSIQQKESGGHSPEKAARLCLYLLSEKSKGLFGKTISAIWDDYQAWHDLEALSRSERFTYRRVTE